MSTSAARPASSLASAGSAPTWRRAEPILLAVAVLSLVTILIHLNKVWGNLPAHPLIVHVPVVLIPVSVLGAAAVLYRPDLLDRYGIPLCVCAIIAMSSIFLAENAGGALQSDLHLHGAELHLINEHSGAANKLAILFAAFTVFLLGCFTARRVSGGMTFGVAALDNTFSRAGVQIALRVLLGILAIACAYYVYRVGDLGARAVWAGRLGH